MMLLSFILACACAPTVATKRRISMSMLQQGTGNHLRHQSGSSAALEDAAAADTDPVPGLQVALHSEPESEDLTKLQTEMKLSKQHALLNVSLEKQKNIPWETFAEGKTMGNLSQEANRGYWGGKVRRTGEYDDYYATPKNETLHHVIMAIGGGTGAAYHGPINAAGRGTVDRDLLRRMHIQDKAVMFLVLMVYMVALAFSASLSYRHSCNNSPVTYYSDPRFNNLCMVGNDLDVFLDSFNQAPKNISLQVAGFVQVPEEMNGSVRWRGNDFQVAFTFSLDLSPWVVRDSQMTRETPIQQQRSLQDGVLPEDRSNLHNYLTNDANDLSYVEIAKKVSWPEWEELATNIKHQIRQAGFTGVISVDRNESDEMQVFKNTPWANFMHARATRVLCALSIFGWMVYVPYMWLRCRKQAMGSHFRVDVSIADYWPLIADKLTADGFQDQPPPAPSTFPSGFPPSSLT